MYCKFCGTPTDNLNNVCNACGGYAPTRRRQPAKPKGIMGMIKGYMHLIVATFSLIMLVFGILNLFSVFYVLFNVSCPYMHSSEYFAIGEAANQVSLIEGGVGGAYAGNIIFGLFSLLGAFIGVLYTLKRMLGMGLYVQLIGRYVGRFGGPALLMGALGVTGALLQVIMYLFCSGSKTITGTQYDASIGVNWTTWMLLLLYCGLIALDILVPKNKKRR